MTMLGRRPRGAGRPAARPAAGGGTGTLLDARPGGEDEETVAVERRTFRRRRWQARWRRLRPWLIGLLVLALVGTGVWLVWFSSVMTVSTVRVTGLQQLGAPRVEEVARVPLGRQLARVDLAAIEARVETLPAVRDADVSRSWPDTVRIDVVEREPVAVVSWGEGTQAVDEEGVLFRRFKERPEELPLIRTAPDVRTEALAEAARVIGVLPGEVADEVDYLDVESVDRVLLRLRDGRDVLWGSAEQAEQKAEVLAVLLDRPETKDVRRIDVSVPGRPTTR